MTRDELVADLAAKLDAQAKRIDELPSVSIEDGIRMLAGIAVTTIGAACAEVCDQQMARIEVDTYAGISHDTHGHAALLSARDAIRTLTQPTREPACCRCGATNAPEFCAGGHGGRMCIACWEAHGRCEQPTREVDRG